MKWLNGNRKLLVVESVLVCIVVVAFGVTDQMRLGIVCGALVSGATLFFKFNLDEHKAKVTQEAPPSAG